MIFAGPQPSRATWIFVRALVFIAFAIVMRTLGGP